MAQVVGVATGDMGVGRDGERKPDFQPGMELRATVTLFGEGCRGSLTKGLVERHGLRDGVDPQTYAIGIKELWEVTPEASHPGRIVHTIGWPLDRSTYGGSFIYHLKDGLVAVGYVVGLDYQNPYLSPFDEFQRFKQHPEIRPIFEGGKRIAYGARALNEGGLQSIPKLTLPGAAIIGCAAGFLNVPKVKGTHTAMKSGMVAAESAFEAIQAEDAAKIAVFRQKLEASWLWPELYRVRNIRPAFRWGLFPGLAYAAFDTYVMRGRAPWTLHHHADHTQLKKAKDAQPIDYPKPDGRVSFDRLSSVFLSNTNHEEDQPVHLTLKDDRIAIDVNYAEYDARRPATAPPASTRSCSRRWAAPADQRAELRALQDLRHQGPDPEHPLDRPRGLRRAELSRRDVAGVRVTPVLATCLAEWVAACQLVHETWLDEPAIERRLSEALRTMPTVAGCPGIPACPRCRAIDTALGYFRVARTVRLASRHRLCAAVSGDGMRSPALRWRAIRQLALELRTGGEGAGPVSASSKLLMLAHPERSLVFDDHAERALWALAAEAGEFGAPMGADRHDRFFRRWKALALPLLRALETGLDEPVLAARAIDKWLWLRGSETPGLEVAAVVRRAVRQRSPAPELGRAAMLAGLDTGLLAGSLAAPRGFP
jgi:flavin-dependent dehydrogenase